jgi:hypothetical protein
MHEPEFRVTVEVHGNINDSLPQPIEQPTPSEYPQRRDAYYVQSTRVRLSFLAWFPTSWDYLVSSIVTLLCPSSSLASGWSSNQLILIAARRPSVLGVLATLLTVYIQSSA